MTGNGIIKDLLKKYDLMLPILSSEQRRIYRSKRRTLGFILGSRTDNRVFISAAVRFYYMLNLAGIRLTLVSAGRAVVFASFITVLMFAGVSVLVLHNYIYREGVIAVNEVQRSGVLVASGDLSIIRGGDKPVQIKSPGIIKSGDRLVTDMLPAFVQTDGRAVIKIFKHSSVAVIDIGLSCRFELTYGGIISKVRPLTGGVTYIVETPDCTVSVVGTEFGVFRADGGTKVVVAKGRVKVRDKTSGVEYIVDRDCSTEVNSNGAVRGINPEEASVMKEIEGIEYTDSIGTMSDSELDSIRKKLLGYKNTKADRGITLEQIKERYGRIDEVVLYSGKVIKGAIISRDGDYRMVTQNGIVSIPQGSVKSSRIIK